MKTLLAAVSTAGLIAGSALADEAKSVQVTRLGSQASAVGPGSYFTGTVRIDAPFAGNGGARVGGATVTFEPGARTAWHTHPLGQTLIVTAGAGRVQHWGGPVQVIRAGDTVWIPPGVKHWHGAAPATAMTHIAIAEALDGKVVEWLEQVSETQYKTPPATTPVAE
jgi:quercetin dioxygenase-like cupin family protein